MFAPEFNPAPWPPPPAARPASPCARAEGPRCAADFPCDAAESAEAAPADEDETARASQGQAAVAWAGRHFAVEAGISTPLG